MPAKSRPLGFPCPDCKLEYGSISVENRKDWWEKGKKRKRALGRTHDSYGKKLPRMSTSLTPVEYALRNAIISKAKQQSLGTTSQHFEDLQLNPLWNLLPNPEKQKQKLIHLINKSVSDIKAETKYKQEGETEEKKQEEESNYARWDATEELENLDVRESELMRKMAQCAAIEEVEMEAEDESKGLQKSRTKKVIVKWNPIMEIKKYRHSVDPLRHLVLPMNFYGQVLYKYNVSLKDLPEESKYFWRKAFEVINIYRKQFSNKKWCYTLYEWFWIARYAKFRTPRIAANMLQALDGKVEGRMSPKQIKNRIEPILEYWREFFIYGSCFFEFLKIIHEVIGKDRELNEEHKKRLEAAYVKNKNSAKEITRRHLCSIAQQQQSYNNTSEYEKTRGIGNDEDFKVIKKRPQRIRIYHYNQNYQKEIDEFNKGLRGKPWRRKRCGPFKLPELPYTIIEQLYKRGRIQL
jgi:hypothetical protein